MLGNELEDAEVVDNPEQVVGDQPPQPQPQPLPVVPALPEPQPAAQPAQPPRTSTTPIININFIGNVSRANQELVSQLLATGQLPAGFAAPPTPPITPPPALARPLPGPMRNRAAQPQMVAPWEGALAPAPLPARRGPGRPPGRRSNGVSFLAAMAAAAGPSTAPVPLALAGPHSQAPQPLGGPQAQAPLAAAAGPSQPAPQDPPANGPQAQAPVAEAGPFRAPGAPSPTSICMVCRCPRGDLGIITKCRHLLCIECKNALLRRGRVGQCPNGYCQVMFQESDFLLFRT